MAYEEYFLLDNKVIEVPSWVTNHDGTKEGMAYDPITSGQIRVVTEDELIDPSRLQLLLAGPKESKGGLLKEEDIKEGDWVFCSKERTLRIHKVDKVVGDFFVLASPFLRPLQCTSGDLDEFRLPTPAEFNDRLLSSRTISPCCGKVTIISKSKLRCPECGKVDAGQKTNQDTLDKLFSTSLDDPEIRVSFKENKLRRQLAKTFEKVRIDKGISLQDFADKMDAPSKVVYRILHKHQGGDITLSSLVKAADILGLELKLEAHTSEEDKQ